MLGSQGFDPREFDFVEDFPTSNATAWPALVHRPTGYFFVFRQHQHGYWVEFSPGSDKAVESYGTAGWDAAVRPKFLEWLGYLRRELDAPDVWGALRGEASLVASDVGDGDNEPFSEAERDAVRAQLREAKELIRGHYELSDTQFQALEARLDYLAGAVDRLGKLDWREAFVGAMLGLVVQAVVPVEPIRQVLFFVSHGLGHLFGMGPAGLPSP